MKVDRWQHRSPYRYLNTRDTVRQSAGGCRHALRRWVYSDNHHTSKGTLGYLVECVGEAGHEGQHKTPDGYAWV